MFDKFYRAAVIDFTEMSSIASRMDQLLDALAPDVFPKNSRPAMPDWLGRVPLPEIFQRPSLRPSHAWLSVRLSSQVRWSRRMSTRSHSPPIATGADPGTSAHCLSMRPPFLNSVVNTAITISLKISSSPPRYFAVSIFTRALFDYDDLTFRG